MGLLLPHKRTFLIYPDMVSINTSLDKPHTGGGRRNEIQGFSKGSRYRLFRLLHALRFERVTFVTLTYGATYPDNGKRAKVHLKAFRRSFERRYGSIPCIWRMEFQRRGAVHFHLLYLDAPFLPVTDVQNIWYKAGHIPHNERFGNAVDLRVNSEKCPSKVIGHYLAKYISKPVGENDWGSKKGDGRIWGKWNVNEPDPIKVELYPVEAERIINQIIPPQGDTAWRPLDQFNFTCFGSQMGSGLYQSRIASLISEELTRRLKVEQKIRIIDTSNRALVCL